MTNISMKSLLEAGVHFGHQTWRWNPKMAKYIFGSRNNIHIIDLSKTVKELKKALKFLRDTAASGKDILFVGTTKQSQESIAETAIKCGSPYVKERWLGGTLTNFNTIQKSIGRLKEIERMREEKILAVLSKKENSRLEKIRARLEKSLCGVKEMKDLPGALFIIDPMVEMTAVQEARKLEIPIVAVSDTNCDPDLIDYPIPGNDDAVRSVRLFCTYMGDAVTEGKTILEKSLQEQREGIEKQAMEKQMASQKLETQDLEPLLEIPASEPIEDESVLKDSSTATEVEVSPQEHPQIK